jgi:hypothetical protein
MYLGSRNDWHFYQCAGCGLIMLPSDGLIRRSQESNSKSL